jgi:hypothetical protein
MSGNKRKIAAVNASLAEKANQLSMKVIKKILIKYHRVSDYSSLKQHCQPGMTHCQVYINGLSQWHTK